MRRHDSGVDPAPAGRTARAAETPDLSVVVGSIESERSIGRCLSSVEEACRGLPSELIVVDASRDRTAERARARDGVTVVSRAPGTLVPDLWAEGIRRSRGRWVALTTGHCTVPPGWAAALTDALREGAAGAGAGLRTNPDVGVTDRAVFHLRYGAFLDLTRGGRRPVDDLPGDNVAYVGDELRRFLEARPGRGFWEIEYHAEVRDRGGRLVAVPEATAGFGPAFPFGTILHHRFVHGRHHGGWRVREDGQPRWRVLLPAPLVPFVLLGRAARRSLGHPEHRRSLIVGAAPFLALSAAWAAGEAVGAVGADAGPGDGGAP